MSEVATHLCNQDAEIERLKSENARLAAAIDQLKDKERQCMEHMHCYRCGMPDVTRHGEPHFVVAAYDLGDGRGELTHIMQAYCADCERAMGNPKERP